MKQGFGTCDINNIPVKSYGTGFWQVHIHTFGAKESIVKIRWPGATLNKDTEVYGNSWLSNIAIEQSQLWYQLFYECYKKRVEIFLSTSVANVLEPEHTNQKGFLL